jgi:hypothetical protein
MPPKNSRPFAGSWQRQRVALHVAAALILGGGGLARAQTPAPSLTATPSVSTAAAKQEPAPTTRALIDSISGADLQEVINLLKTNYLNPAALSDQEMARATLEGLIVRLAPGASILQAQTANTTGSSPFREEILDGRIGYVRLGALSKSTAGELDAALKNFSEKMLKSAVLDLRATPVSGDFDAAAEILKRFCPRGQTLFTIKKTNTKQERVFTSDRDPQFLGVLAVLVDHETAGAPEVIAAVLRAQARALVIGETTRGQAVDYADLPLRDGKVLRVAEAMVMLPGNIAIFPAGVKPDLVARLSADDKNEIMKQSLDKGISPFVFETERPKLNEAALVAGINPELDALEAAQGKKQESKQALRDTALQRAVDFITTVGFYGAGAGSK